MYHRLYQRLEKKGTVVSAVFLTGEKKGCRCILEDDGSICRELSGGMDWKPFETVIKEAGETKTVPAGKEELLVEIFRKSPHLVILGGGHVSQPTAEIGKMLGFHVTVMDDREELLKEERFPHADERIVGSFTELSEKIPPYENSWYVVLTRNHAGDTVCVRQILKRPYAYLGMIGSRTKVRLTKEALLADGFPKALLDTIHAPVGLPIGGQLPEEIAVSIAAELVQEKNRHYTAYTDEQIAREVLLGTAGIMMTIVKKSGSSPRGTGSKLFLTQDGRVVGSIGGGSVEYEAIRHAREITGPEIVTYHLSPGDEKNLGMVCGGTVEVLFEKVESQRSNG